MSPLTPDRLLGRSAGEIGKIELVSSNRRVAAGDLFTITAGDAAELVIRGGTARLDRIGQDMSEGAITVEGDAGAQLGERSDTRRVGTESVSPCRSRMSAHHEKKNERQDN